MTIKRIELPKKPISKSTNEFIENWVSGNVSVEDNRSNINKFKRTTIYLPETLHKNLKLKSIDEGTSMTDLIVKAIENYLKHQ